MLRSRRTQIASSSARVAPSRHNPSTSNTSAPGKIDSMAPKKKPRGRPPKFKTTQESDEIEGSGTRKQTKAKAVKRKTRAVEAEVEDEQPSALYALKKRMSAGKTTRNSNVGAEEPLKSSKTSSKDTAIQRRSTSRTERATRSHVTSTPLLRNSSVQRRGTPSLQPNTDEDLYGLSPEGKAAEARFEARRASIQRPPPSTMKVQGTPGMETSIIALANFKRRPRQLSMIRMVQQTSELGHADSELDRDLNFELDHTLQDFEDFMPEDESTPLNFGKKKRDADEQQSGLTEQLRTSSSRKRRHNDDEDVIQIPSSSSLIASSPPRQTTSPRPNRSSSLPEERIIPSTEAEQDPINAEPLSQSSNMDSPQVTIDLPSNKRQKTRGRPPKIVEVKATKNKTRKASKVSTAHLQSLLPKPRKKAMAKRRTGVYYVSSDVEEDTTFDFPEEDDELARPVRSQRRGTSVAATKAPLRQVDANKKLRKSPSKSSLQKGKQKKTYGRQKSLEQENSVVPSDEEDDDTLELSVGGKAGKVAKTRELEKAKKMFEEVDQWEMEFESVDLGGGESSPWR